MTSWILLLGLTVGQVGSDQVEAGIAAPHRAPHRVQDVPVDGESRSFHQMDQSILTALRRAQDAQALHEKAQAIYDLVDLHREIVGDRRFAESDVLKQYRMRVSSRLLSFRNELARDIRNAPRNASRKSVRNPERSLSEELGDSLADQLSLVGYSLGGPVSMMVPRGEKRFARFGGAAQRDLGQSLVDLIQRTIRPEFWDVNGGPGTIRYYEAWHCLVVRATSEVHTQLGGLTGQLR